jgi:hypothetical protein
MELRTIVMEKNEMLALIGLSKTDEGASITTVDPRREHPLVKTYEPWLVEDEFKKVLRLSLRNGWRVIYDGPPSWG